MTSPQPAPIKLRELGKAWRWKHRRDYLMPHLIYDEHGKVRYTEPHDPKDRFDRRRFIPRMFR